MSARWPAMHTPGMIDVPGNDSRHDLPDSNRGGSPRGGAGTKHVSTAQRGGFQAAVRQPSTSLAGRGGSGNPASRGGFKGQARGGAMKPEARIGGHGGSPQERGGAGSGRNFGVSGQTGVPTGRASNPQPGAGNTSGTAYRRIAGRFQRKAMGAQPTESNSGKYGSAPVTANT